MQSQLQTVLEIASVGTVILFMALVGLVGLMYLLTMPWPFGKSARPAEGTAAPAEVADELREQEAREERDRQLRAVVLAVAVACAEAERSSAFLNETTSDWRRVHRSRRLGQRTARARIRL